MKYKELKKMEIIFFILMLFIAGIFLYFDYKESSKGRYKSRFKLLAFKSVIITILIILTFQLYGNQVTYSTGVIEKQYYKADNVTLDYITKDPVLKPIPLSKELATIFLMLTLYMTYWISDTFTTQKRQRF